MNMTRVMIEEKEANNATNDDDDDDDDDDDTSPWLETSSRQKRYSP